MLGGSQVSYWHDLLDVSDEKIQIFRTAKDGFDVRCEREMCWRPMVTTHWPRLLRHHGYNMEGRCVIYILAVFEWESAFDKGAVLVNG